MKKLEASKTIEHTQSLCPVCLDVVDARIVETGSGVYMKKVCPDHGPMTVKIWPDADHYRWMNAFRLPHKSPHFQRTQASPCPQDCGLCSAHLRHPTLVEIEITQRCNLSCPVCFMAAGDAPEDPSLETLEGMYAAIREQCGANTSIQITGGEPSVRADLPEIVRLGVQTGFSAIEINTNGLIFSHHPELLNELAEAGLSGIYLQFDGLEDHIYQKIRGRSILSDKLRLIEHCRRAGIQVVLAMTVIWGINHDSLGTVLRFALENLDVVAGVAYQPAFTSGRFDVTSNQRLSMGDVIFMLAEQSEGLLRPYDLWPLGCSHPLCSAATLLTAYDGKTSPLTRRITQEEYIAHFNPSSPQGSVFSDISQQLNGGTQNSLPVVVMNYMDCMTVDLKRLMECSMVVTMEDGRLIPFCAYQFSDLNGKRLYAPWGRRIEDRIARTYAR